MSQWDNQAVSVLNRAQLGYTDGDTNVSNVDNSYITNASSNPTIPVGGNDINGNNRMSGPLIEDGSYLRIQIFRYHIHAKWMKSIGVSTSKYMQTLRMYILLQSIRVLDPEIGSYNQRVRVCRM